MFTLCINRYILLNRIPITEQYEVLLVYKFDKLEFKLEIAAQHLRLPRIAHQTVCALSNMSCTLINDKLLFDVHDLTTRKRAKVAKFKFEVSSLCNQMCYLILKFHPSCFCYQVKCKDSHSKCIPGEAKLRIPTLRIH